MSSLVSSWSKNVQSVPANYVFPEDKRPGSDFAAPVCKDIPVIDLSQQDGLGRLNVIQQIMKANQDSGMFQFFNMPAEDKAMYYSEDGTKGFRLYTSSLNYIKDGVNTWKDSVKHTCEPLEDNIQSWPEKPARYREVVGAYTVEVRKLSYRILDLICEGLGVPLGYFGDELSKYQLLVAHHYPPCPDPSLVLGVGGHTDTTLITLLQQDIYGLQILKDEQWLGVEPLPHAFVVNISDQLECLPLPLRTPFFFIVVFITLSTSAHLLVAEYVKSCFKLTMMEASQDFGIFQVINHGISEELMDDTMMLFKEFFDMPAEDKAVYFSEDKTKGFRLFTGKYSPQENEVHYWRDVLRHRCQPLEEKIQSWPEKPAQYREVVGAYVVEVKKLSLRILDLICKGLGIELGYFGDEMSKTQDLSQEAYGLQIFNDGKWVGVEPLPHAFVVGINDQLELKSALHRAVTNASTARTSLVNFISASPECIIEPAKALVNESNPRLFKPISHKDYFEFYLATVSGAKGSAVELLKLQG
ncbi:hypothetical protein Vadar_033351 [Vaccinium darrowii]|uniref:Uncharacterized protein n=1 Tax=Vaccinium darrowii TaxID=229202 RepID=A0ACB7ZG45_9ERIC|nr:hypothetical protein Vadar_033351 [Vaccinium darrowii]